MRKAFWIGASLLALVSAAHAQSSPGTTLAGEWTGRIIVPSLGREYGARLDLRPAGEGTWRAIVPGADTCINLQVPVTWESAQPDAVAIRFLASKALTGCRDSEMRFERVDAQTFKGRTSAGNDIVLTRR